MNPLTLLQEQKQAAKNEINRLDVEIERTRERWKNEEAAYSKMVEDRKKFVAQYDAYRDVLLMLEEAALRRRR